MKKRCQIEVTSRRKYTFGANPRLPLPTVEDLEDEFWEEEVSDELFAPEGTDRQGEKLFDPTALSKRSSSTLTSFGIFSKEEDGSYRVTYEDSEATGLDGCLTTFCLSPSGMLIMLRRGEVKTCMVFEKGCRHLCDYGARGGIPSVILHTHVLSAEVTEEGGSLFVDYSVEIRGVCTERNELEIHIKCE